ncbi:MAG: hypothetical protein ACSHWU_10085 [Marinicella sp.]
MMRRIGFVMMILVSLQISAGHEIEYRVSPLGNLVYQLDCMAQVSRFQCSKQSFTELWQSEIKAVADDAVMLEQWQSLRTKLDDTVEFIKTPDVKMATSPNFPINASNQLNVLEQTRIMAFATGSVDAYRQHIELLLSPSHVQAELKILNHFFPRFEFWFKSQQAGLDEFVTDANKLTEELNINQLLSDMRIFYQSELPADLILPVYLIAHPQAKAHSSGLVFGQNSLIEVLKGEQASDRLAVVIHEIAHFYHERASLDHHMMTMNFFTGSKSKTGKVGYYLFNEALASAIGNGLLEQRMNEPAYFERYLAYPMSFYANQGIDQAGKAALPLVTKQIENKQSINPEFLQALDATWSQALKDLKDTPAERLRHVGIIDLTQREDDLINQMFNLLRPSSANINDGAELDSEKFVLNRYPKLDVIILANSWEQLEPFNIDGLELKNQPAEGIHTFTNDEGAVRLFIVSHSSEFMINSLTELLSKPTF